MQTVLHKFTVNCKTAACLEKDFKFLGSYKSADGDCTNEIKRRIAMARQMAVELTTIWKDKNVTTSA